jgi:hypothetical protein
VLRYWGDVTADWNGAPSADPVTFQGPVVALAIVDDEPTGGVFTLFLHANGAIADEWQLTLEDALEALSETDEFDALPRADIA